MGRRYRMVEEHRDDDLGRAVMIVWDAVEACYYAEEEGDLIDAFVTLHEARDAARAQLRAYREE